MIDKLVKNIQKTNAPIVVGLDPMLNYVPSISRRLHLQSMERHSRVLLRLYGSSTRE